MHLLQTTASSLDDSVEPVDLGQTPGDIVVLSFADSDLAGLAAAYAAERHRLPSVRLAHLRDLRHPMSIDLWIDKVARHAKVIVVQAARRAGLVALRRRGAVGDRTRAEHRAGRAARRGPRRSAPRCGFDLACRRACGAARVFPRRRAREFAGSAAPSRRSCRGEARPTRAADPCRAAPAICRAKARSVSTRLPPRSRRDSPSCRSSSTARRCSPPTPRRSMPCARRWPRAGWRRRRW